MKDWVQKLDAFLQFNEREILAGSGRVSMEVAKNLALEEYAKFSQRRIAEEDAEAAAEFERTVRELENKGDEG
ncbi:dna-binding protein [hydrocarbon metagenome]|uniref:Dna-binding protein n=1 Tax=hydrocarbon metagenome TaxID=938273 RepID=A0A0W8F108_9ZZZZ